MKTFSVEKLQGEPILLSTAFPEWRAVAEMDAFIDEFMSHIEGCAEPVYYIANLTEWKPDFQEILVAANKAARNANAMLHHRNVREFVLVTPMRVVEMAGNGLKSSTFGSVNIAVFQTLDAALNYVRGKYQAQVA